MASAPPPAPYRIEVRGAARTPLRDAYHAFLRMPWVYALGLIIVSYLLLNALFAVAYLATAGVKGARAGSFADAYFFSVQTMGTIGYGAMYPVTQAANLVVVAESVSGLLVTALATGLVFAKFARTTSRMVFSRRAVIAPLEGVPTLMIRLGNERGNNIIDSRLRVVLARTERTREGVTLYRMYDLALVRERMPVLSRSWTALHPIVPGSPLAGKTPEDLHTEEVELNVTLVGIDDVSLQQVHATHRYMDDEIIWGARHADVLREVASDHLILDLGKFHELSATEPTGDFPYPRADPRT